MLDSMRLTRDSLSMESMVGGGEGSAFSRLFPQLVGFMKDIAAHFSPETKAMMLTNSEQKFVSNVGRHNYMDIAPMVAYTPEGLESTYLEYAKSLNKAVEHVYNFAEKELPAFCTYLAMLISSHDQKFTTTDRDTAYQEMEAKRKALAEEMAGHFIDGSKRTSRTLEDVVARNAEWHDVFNQMKAMNVLINKIDRTKLRKKVDEVEHFLEIIQKKTERGEMDGSSPQTIRALADGAYQMASEVQFYSIVYWRVLVLNEAVNQTVDHFQKVVVDLSAK